MRRSGLRFGKSSKDNFISTEFRNEFRKEYELCESFWRDLEEDLQIYDSNYDPHIAKPELTKKFSSKISEFKSKFLSILDLVYENKNKEGINWWGLANLTKEYCLYVVGGRCEEIENSIIRLHYIAREYAEEVLNDRWIELEDYMEENCKDPADIYTYWRGVIEKHSGRASERWEKFEKIISSLPPSESSASVVVSYCDECECRIAELEGHILSSPEHAFHYARDVIGERWPEAESVLLKNIEIATNYIETFKFRWPAYEHKIRNKPKRIIYYARNVIKGKLPDELHNKMLMLSLSDKDKYYCDEYFNYLSDCEKDTVSYLKSISEEERNILLSKV